MILNRAYSLFFFSLYRDISEDIEGEYKSLERIKYPWNKGFQLVFDLHETGVTLKLLQNTALSYLTRILFIIAGRSTGLPSSEFDHGVCLDFLGLLLVLYRMTDSTSLVNFFCTWMTTAIQNNTILV